MRVGPPSLLPFNLWVGNNLHGFQIKFHVRKKEGDAHIGRNTPRAARGHDQRTFSFWLPKKATEIKIANIYNIPTNQIGMTK